MIKINQFFRKLFGGDNAVQPKEEIVDNSKTIELATTQTGWKASLLDRTPWENEGWLKTNDNPKATIVVSTDLAKEDSGSSTITKVTFDSKDNMAIDESSSSQVTQDYTDGFTPTTIPVTEAILEKPKKPKKLKKSNTQSKSKKPKTPKFKDQDLQQIVDNIG